MKSIITIIAVAAALTTVLSGCGSRDASSVQNTNPPLQSEVIQIESSSGTESSSEAEPSSGAESSAVAEPSTGTELLETAAPDLSGETEKIVTEFQSDFGYTISYEEDSFDYRRTEGYDEFILKSDAVDKPYVFVCVSHVGAEFVDQMKDAALGENPENCIIGQAEIKAQYTETEEAWEGGKVIHKTYVCPLDSGDALLIETQWYTEQTDDPYAAWLWEMVESIRL